MFWDTKLPLWGNTSHWVASIKQLPADGKKESCLQWKVSKTTYVFMSLYTVSSCLIWKGSCFHKSILFTPSTSLFLCLRLQEQLCCSLPRQKPHLRSAGGSAGSRLRNTWPGRDRASRLYVLHACVCVYVSGRGWVCVCVCKVKSFGDFWRFQLKLKEDNGWFCSHTPTHTFRDMCWHFPRLGLRDVWTCQYVTEQSLNSSYREMVAECVGICNFTCSLLHLETQQTLSKKKSFTCLLLQSQSFKVNNKALWKHLPFFVLCILTAGMTSCYSTLLRQTSKDNKLRPAGNKIHKQQHLEHHPCWEQEQAVCAMHVCLWKEKRADFLVSDSKSLAGVK